MDDEDGDKKRELPASSRAVKVSRGALQAVGGGIPFLGGLFSAVASNWSEKEQQRINEFFHAWLQLREDEF